LKVPNIEICQIILKILKFYFLYSGLQRFGKERNARGRRSATELGARISNLSAQYVVCYKTFTSFLLICSFWLNRHVDWLVETDVSEKLRAVATPVRNFAFYQPSPMAIQPKRTPRLLTFTSLLQGI
jgi:hypothetical protein